MPSSVSAPGAWRWLSRVGLGFTAVVATAQISVGVLWWCFNLGAVPAYGDTPEYLALSADLRPDGYRTIGYPAILRLMPGITTSAATTWPLALYVLQTVVMIGAVGYLVAGLVPRARRRVVVCATAIAVTSPLALHYATSVLTDSLAASFFVVALAAAARIVTRQGRRGRAAAVAAVASLAAGLLRTEKPAVLLAIAAVLALAVWLGRARSGAAGTPWPARAAVAAVALALAVPAGAAAVINHETQTADRGRTPPGLVTALVSRVVWPHLAAARDGLPADVQVAITDRDAHDFDTHNNNALPMVATMRSLDNGGDAVTLAAVRAAVRCCAVSIVTDTAGDALEYAFTPFTFAVEGSQAVSATTDDGSPTAWDVSRMEMAGPGLARLLLVVSFVLLAVLVAVVTVAALGEYRASVESISRRHGGYALVVWGGTVVNGVFFAAAQGADANVRYGLSTSLVVVSMLAAATCVLLDRAARDRLPLQGIEQLEQPGSNPAIEADGPSGSEKSAGRDA